MNIALLERDPAMVDIIATFLRLHGYHVDVYTDDRVLLEALAGQVAIDLVILSDTFAGELTANEIVQYLRQRTSVPVLVLSAEFEQEDVLKAAFPDLPLIRKPFPIKEVLEQVREITGSS
jgi:DNA-binding response OmpR family regulator